MTQPAATSTQAEPQAPAAAPTTPFVAPAVELTQEDRMLAAASYLGYLVGFWLVVPIVVYVLKREKSRFVAFHALQAIVIHVLGIPVLIFGMVFPLVMTAVIALAVQPKGANQEAFGVVMMLAYLLGMLVPWGVYLALSVVCAVRAMQGRMARFPVAAWLTDRFLAGDKGVARS